MNNTVTITRNEYEEMALQADLYQTVLSRLPERKWATELYNKKRIAEFRREDRIDPRLFPMLTKAIGKQPDRGRS